MTSNTASELLRFVFARDRTVLERRENSCGQTHNRVPETTIIAFMVYELVTLDEQRSKTYPPIIKGN